MRTGGLSAATWVDLEENPSLVSREVTASLVNTWIAAYVACVSDTQLNRTLIPDLQKLYFLYTAKF